MIDLCGFISEIEHTAKKQMSDVSSVGDASKILFTLDKLPKSYSARAKYIKLLQSASAKEPSQAAHTASALDILASHSDYVPDNISKYTTDKFFSSLPWLKEPDKASMLLCSVFSLLYRTSEFTYDEYEKFINTMHSFTDGDTGLIRSGFIDYRRTEPMLYMKGFFYYLVILEYTHSPIRYPSRTIDTCIQFYDRGHLPEPCADKLLECLSWVYCTSRTMRQTGYRYNDCKKRLLEFEEKFCKFLTEFDLSKADIHMLLIIMCTVAEMQSALPGTIKTPCPLKNVLNEITFI